MDNADQLRDLVIRGGNGKEIDKLTKLLGSCFIHPQAILDLEVKREWEAGGLG